MEFEDCSTLVGEADSLLDSYEYRIVFQFLVSLCVVLMSPSETMLVNKAILFYFYM